MGKITIVTAFFDIGREKMRNFERGREHYLKYFSFWAGIQNDLVIYTDEQMAGKVKKIRADFNLLEKTKVIVIEDIFQIESDIYLKMKKVLSSPDVISNRKHTGYPEAYSAEYNYVTYLKPWFVKNAIKSYDLEGLITWMDFGYNHGGALYDRREDFNFLWEYEFSDKIHLFSIKKLNELPVFDIVKKMPVDMSAGIIIAPERYWEFLYESFRISIQSLMNCDMVDDDQTLLIMSYRRRKENFEIHIIEDWFMVLKNFGGSHLHINNNMMKRIKYKRMKLFMLESFYNKKWDKTLYYCYRYVLEKLKNYVGNKYN